MEQVAQSNQESINSRQTPELPVVDFDTMTFYVGNAKQTAYYYHHYFGFDIVAYQGPETGHRDACSYLLEQNNVRFLFTSGLLPEHEVTRHVALHGDGVKDVGYQVEDLENTFKQAVERGATVVKEPWKLSDEQGVVQKAVIGTYGETTHTLVDRTQYQGLYEPGFAPKSSEGQAVGLFRVDHLVGNVDEGGMWQWADYYNKVFGFHVMKEYEQGDISTQYSALISLVMANKSLSVRMPLNESAKGLKKSQVDEYLDFYQSPGVQHLAISTHDIIPTVRAMRERGVEFITVPDTYYEELPGRVGEIDEDIAQLKELGILVDRESDGYLLQIFTHPMQDRPTFFFEIIQRKKAQGFGQGNFQALFEAIERDQDSRGNL